MPLRLRLAFFRAIAPCLVVAAMLAHGGAAAQTPTGRPVTLTESQILGYIAASDAIYALTGRRDGASPNRRNPEMRARLEEIARQNRFRDYAEYSKVAASILYVMIRIDPRTKRFVDPTGEIARAIVETRADPSLSDEQRQLAIEILDDVLETAITVHTPANIELVERYYERIGATLR